MRILPHPSSILTVTLNTLQSVKPFWMMGPTVSPKACQDPDFLRTLNSTSLHNDEAPSHYRGLVHKVSLHKCICESLHQNNLLFVCMIYQYWCWSHLLRDVFSWKAYMEQDFHVRDGSVFTTLQDRVESTAFLLIKHWHSWMNNQSPLNTKSSSKVSTYYMMWNEAWAMSVTGGGVMLLRS